MGRGETLGVIGATGSGKTTLIQLLQRFYPPDEGAIYVDGENIAGMEEARLHGLFGVAFQSDAFFAGTIDENIDLGRGLPGKPLKKRPAARRPRNSFWPRRRATIIPSGPRR